MATAYDAAGTWTEALVGLNVLSFLAQAYVPAWERNALLYDGLSMNPGNLKRLVLSSFLHDGWYHLCTNMYGLWTIGRRAERSFGPSLFLWIYSCSTLGASALSAWSRRRPHRGFGLASASASASASVGASGGICGATAALLLHRQRHGLPAKDLWLALALDLGWAASFASVDGMAHLGGAIAGAVAACLWGPRYVRAWGGTLVRNVPWIAWPFA